jgi:hypothetical protein
MLNLISGSRVSVAKAKKLCKGKNKREMLDMLLLILGIGVKESQALWPHDVPLKPINKFILLPSILSSSR